MADVIPLFPEVEPGHPGLRTWSGINKETGRPVWVVEHVDEEGVTFTIAVTERHAEVHRFITAWEAAP